MKWLLITLNLSLHAAFIWGRFAVFRVDGRTPRGVRIIELSSLSSILLGASVIGLRANNYMPLDAAAVGCGVVSGALFAWGVRTIRFGRLTAAFSDDMPAEIITWGPFRFVRNPFYVAYLLAYFQAFIASGSAWALLPVFWMACLYRRAAQIEERKFLSSTLAAAYRSYAARTGRFVPFRSSSRHNLQPNP